MRSRLAGARPSPAVAVLLVVLACAAALVVLHGANAVTADGRVLGLDREASAATWFTSALFLLAGLAAAAVAAVLHTSRRTAWLGLALLLVAFSGEEVVGLHEEVEAETSALTSILSWQTGVALVAAGLALVACRRKRGLLRLALGGAAASILVAQALSALGAAADLPHALVVAVSTVEELAEMGYGTGVLVAAVEVLTGLVEVQRRPGG